MRPIVEIIADLSKPLKPRHVKVRKKGGSSIPFIEWHIACNYLDLYAAGWSWEIVSIFEQGALTVVHGRLTIPSADGMVSRDAAGIEDTAGKNYGDAVSNASAKAFKRAAAMFGLARYLYANKEGATHDNS